MTDTSKSAAVKRIRAHRNLTLAITWVDGQRVLGQSFIKHRTIEAEAAERDALRAENAKLREVVRKHYRAVRPGDLGEWDRIYNTAVTDTLAALATEPAAPMNQCDGCQAGIPLENGKHRMGKGEYPARER